MQAGVKIHIATELTPGFPVDTWFHCQKELPPGLRLNPKSLGLRWREMGSEKPDTGTEIRNTALGTALRDKMKFTREEFDRFHVQDDLQQLHPSE